MNAAALVVWYLFNASTGQLAFPDRFPTQTDCLRAASTLHQVERHYQPYVCHSLTVANPYDSGAGLGGGWTGSPGSSGDSRARAARNYQSEQDHIQEILSHPPQPVR